MCNSPICINASFKCFSKKIHRQIWIIRHSFPTPWNVLILVQIAFFPTPRVEYNDINIFQLYSYLDVDFEIFLPNPMKSGNGSQHIEAIFLLDKKGERSRLYLEM